ncbi:uncharacterized protein N7473_002989 [Penicillium subrubescens]|uniref:uncharacterized protein n=1 Tax=Penicillium subrubescens TaxID=1316194 RepID=UPI0025454358|nr:uncharacterized protein N7473_002989 [Penicillium subrubescens]KAJ5906073.1 hypothetical protein N7473_002989 [Penicillium subrubescens]
MGYPMPLVDRSLAIFVVSVVMMIISIVTVSLRAFVRLYLVRGFGWDDALMIASLGLFVTLAACCMIGSTNGIGHAYTDFTSLDVYKRALLWWWLGQMLYIWASAVAKISIALALLRLTVKKAHRIILWVNIGVIIAIGLMFWFVLLLDCQPVSYFWNRVDPRYSGTCLSVDILLDIAYLYSALTIICDLTLGILPVFLVWTLQMNRRTKIAVGGILSLGAIASVAVIIRLPFLQYYADTDFLRNTYQIAIWSVIETGLGITAGSLITLRPLFRWLLDGSVSYGRNVASPGKYPLSSLRSDNLKGSNDPSYWRPDLNINDDNAIMNTVSSPRLNSYRYTNSSQEALYPELTPVLSESGVTVQKTFEQTVSERGG